MKNIRHTVIFLLVSVMGLVLGSCTAIEEPASRGDGYGQLQIKLYKEASYAPAAASGAATKAAKPQLDSLFEARKILLNMMYEGKQVSQTLVFEYASPENAEYGLRSANLKLLPGAYTIDSYVLFDNKDEKLYEATPDETCSEFEVVAGGLTVHELTADTKPRGKVRFRLVKDMTRVPATKSVETQERTYTFDEIRYMDVEVYDSESQKTARFSKLPVKFSIHFDEESDEKGWQTSSAQSDTLVSLAAGTYEVRKITVYDTDRKLLEIQDETEIAENSFEVADNRRTDADVPLTLYKEMGYIADYYALRAIWEALNGPEWSYQGESFPLGANWDFNKDVDLWGAQPGVKLHDNGRVAVIDVSDFGFSGNIPDEIGVLTELVELYLGTHNDSNAYYDPEDPTVNDPKAPFGEQKGSRLERHGQYLRKLHVPTQLSYPTAVALKEMGKSIPEISLYEKYTEEEIFDTKGRQRQIRPMDTNPGTLCNGLESISEEIRNCKKIEKFYIANSPIKQLPAGLAELPVLTDFEVYNCPKLEKMSDFIGNMPALITANLANNPQWTETEADAILNALATGKSSSTLQILYFRLNKATKVTSAFKNFKSLHMLDLSSNRIKTLEPLGSDILFTQLYLDHNQIESVPDDFCGFNGDVESFSLAYNKLTVFPNIFSSRNLYLVGSADFSYNQISSFPAGFKGIRASTLSLAGNKFEKYPVELTTSNSSVTNINLRGNGMKEIPEEALRYHYSGTLPPAGEKPDTPEGENEDYDPTDGNMDVVGTFDFSYNNLSELPYKFDAEAFPYLKSLDLSYNNFDEFPYASLNCNALIVLAVRHQTYPEGHEKVGQRSLREWPQGVYQHYTLRGLYLGGNDLRKVDDTISTLCYNLEISDNPNIVFDASDICAEWQKGLFNLIYDKDQNIINCEAMLD